MPQWLPAMFPAAPNKEIPTIVIAGAMVNGVMNFKMSPKAP